MLLFGHEVKATKEQAIKKLWSELSYESIIKWLFNGNNFDPGNEKEFI